MIMIYELLFNVYFRNAQPCAWIDIWTHLIWFQRLTFSGYNKKVTWVKSIQFSLFISFVLFRHCNRLHTVIVIIICLRQLRNQKLRFSKHDTVWLKKCLIQRLANQAPKGLWGPQDSIMMMRRREKKSLVLVSS